MTELARTAVRGFAVLCLALAWVSGAAAAGTVEKLHVLYCGHSTTGDLSNWSPGANVGKAWTFSDSCYLIRHAKGWMLWESGIADAIADKPEGVVVGNGLLTLYRSRTLQSQLHAPADIAYLGFSHSHGDHVGNANLFTAATLYIQQPEFDAAFGPDAAKSGFNPALYGKLRQSTMAILQGDHDVFGDGSVVILSTPGHTPGHQSLLVRLPRTGAVLLSGDAVHFRENWEQRRVPARNFDRAQSLASMDRIARVLERENAVLWINHDQAQTDTLPHAPQAIE
jgi:glyoxylase-like metal-dependent hydrolase (beta-lactamase superfamily II)